MIHRPILILASCLATAGFAQQTEPFVGAHGAVTPGSYSGMVDDRTEHLDLWPDQSFHLVTGEDAYAGRWHAAPGQNGIVLDLGGEQRILEVRNSQRLRPSGAPADGSGDLESSGALQPTALSLPVTGMFTYLADAPAIVHCATGRSYPVAQEADYLALENAYLENRPGPGEPLFVALTARIETREQMEGPDRLTVVPESLGGVFPGADCRLGNTTLDLADAVWTITALGDEELDASAASREPFVIFDADDMTFAASVGCNQMRGSYTRGDGQLSIADAIASTMMACPDPVADWEARLSDILPDVAGFDIGGHLLRLKDAEDETIAELRAVYLP